jgi:biopolymer transport protein ExbB
MNIRLSRWILAIAAICGMTSPNLAKADDGLHTLEAAWQQEYAYLAAERRELQARLAQQSERSKKAIQAVEDQIVSLEEQVAATRSDREGLGEELLSLQKETSNDQDDAIVLDTTLAQAAESVDSMVHEDQSAEENLERLFNEGLQEAEALRTVHSEPGTYFLANGIQVEGTLLHIGGIATYGISEDSVAALRPIGDNRFQVHEDLEGDLANSIRTGQLTGSLPLFLYEGTGTAVEPAESKTIAQILEAGGVVAYVIAGLGIAALALALIRVWILSVSGRGRRALSGLLGGRLSDERLSQIRALSEPQNSPVRRVVAAAISARDLDRESRMEVATEALLREQPKLERFGTVLVVVAAVAPLLGLLGTVTGMMSTFDVITEHGTGDPRMLSGGISEALITTQLGLIVAIPILLLANGLNAWARSLLNSMERLALAACLDGEEIPTHSDPEIETPQDVEPPRPIPVTRHGGSGAVVANA